MLLELHLARGYQRKPPGPAVVDLPAPRTLEGRRRKVRDPQRAILWVPSLRSTRTPKQPLRTFLSLFRCVSLLESGPFRGPCWVVAARACLVPSARRGGGLLPRGGACAGAGRRALWPTFAGALFWSERWSGSQSACAVAGAGARARPGGGLPTLSEPVAEPSSLGRRHSAPTKIGRLQRSHRRGLDQHAGEARRVPEHLCRWRAQGARAARRGGLPALSELVAEPSGLGVPPQCAQVRCGAAFVRSTFLVGTLERL